MVTSTKSYETPTLKHVPFIRDTPLVGSMSAFLHERLSFIEGLAQRGDVVGITRTCPSVLAHASASATILR